MTEIINLRRARKARDRQEKERGAAENRLKFGQPKAERVQQTTQAERARTHLDGHRLTDKGAVE